MQNENISQEEFENNMNHLLSSNFKEKENQSSLLSIKEESIISMINYCTKFNNTILFFKLIVNLEQIKINNNSNEITSNIDFNECILICFKKLCELVEVTQNSLK